VNNTKLIFILKEKRKMNTIVDLDGIT